MFTWFTSTVYKIIGDCSCCREVRTVSPRFCAMNFQQVRVLSRTCFLFEIIINIKKKTYLMHFRYVLSSRTVYTTSNAYS